MELTKGAARPAIAGIAVRLETIVTALSATILVALIAVRLYLAYGAPVIIRTWDDKDHRQLAESASQQLRPNKVLGQFFLPKDFNFGGMRTPGYAMWLSTGHYLLTSDPVVKTIGRIPNEQIWQTMNLTFLALDGALVFGFAFWASRRVSFALGLTTLYLMAPLIFGINRWVMTENHAYTGLLVFGIGCVMLLSQPPERELSGRRVALVSGFVILFALFHTAREYTLPSYLMAEILVIGWLIRQGRWPELAIFVLVQFPYWVGMSTYLPSSLSHLDSVVQETAKYHPLLAWFTHAFVYAVGPGLGLLLAYLAGESLRVWLLDTRDRIVAAGGGVAGYVKSIVLDWRDWRPLPMLVLAYSALTLFHVAIVAVNGYRTMRPSALVFVSALIAVVAAVRLLGDSPRFPWRRVHLVLAVLLLLGVGEWGKQLFYDFERGRTYYHDANAMEFFNHPVYLYPLRNPEDMHVHPRTQ